MSGIRKLMAQARKTEGKDEQPFPCLENKDWMELMYCEERNSDLNTTGEWMGCFVH